mmetsp:Transcript_49433/g.148937  ORF Transcript_49433/g.148937 Transcript_49433/m.148937 type:complete len:150 (+) Transcript_49433:135-584(+)
MEMEDSSSSCCGCSGRAILPAPRPSGLLLPPPAAASRNVGDRIDDAVRVRAATAEGPPRNPPPPNWTAEYAATDVAKHGTANIDIIVIFFKGSIRFGTTRDGPAFAWAPLGRLGRTDELGTDLGFRASYSYGLRSGKTRRRSTLTYEPS